MKRNLLRVFSFVLAALVLSTGMFYGHADQAEAGDVDLNGTINAADARLALRASASLEHLSPEQSVNSDVDRNGKITAADARLILRCSAKLETLEAYSAENLQSVLLKGDDRKPYESEDYDLKYLADVTIGNAKHVIFDDYVTINVPTKEGTAEEDLLNMVGVIFNEQGKPFFILPDAEARAKGEFKFDTLHFSPLGAAELSDGKLLDLWAERAAAQSTVRRISEDDITPGLAEMLTDCGLAENQYAGAIVRSILSLDTRGEILTAAIDGDGKTLRAKLINFAGEYFLGKLFKQEEDKFLTQSLGDDADAVKKAVKDGKYKEALTDIIKNIEKNMFSYVNYADKIASLTDKLANIWTDDMMNEQYEVYKSLGGTSISDDDWNTVYVQLRGAAHRLSSKGISAADLRKKFEQRVQNEEKIAASKKELLEDVAVWRELGLLNTTYWYNSLGDYPSDIERLNSLRQIRETLKGLLTLDGKFQRGKDYLSDKDFLTDAMFEWVTNGVKGRANFYKWLRDKGVYLPHEDVTPPGGDPYRMPFYVKPGDAISRQDAEYMDLAEQALKNAGTQLFYKKGDERTFDITLSGEGLSVHMTGKYTVGSWEGATGSCTITWAQDFSVDNGGTPLNRRREYYYTANKISVSDRGEGNVYITFTGDHDYYLYEEDKDDGMFLKSGYPIKKINLMFDVTFHY